MKATMVNGVRVTVWPAGRHIDDWHVAFTGLGRVERRVIQARTEDEALAKARTMTKGN